MSTTITREHMKTVADWLDAGGGPLGTERMEYRQSEINCGYACCAVGALSIVSGRGHADAEVFALIAGVELPALGRCAAVAAQLCNSGNQNVGPVIAALFRDDWDSARGAAVVTQQPDGSGFWLDGFQHNQTGGGAWLYVSAQSHGQSGGGAWLYESAQSHGQSGGEAYLYNSAQSHGQSGGEAWLYESAQSHNQTGGDAWLYVSAQSHGQSGGRAVLWDSAQSHGQSGGGAWLYVSAQSHGQSGGEAYLYNSAQSHGQSGGEAWLYESAESHGMLGGTLYVRSPYAKVIDRKGGLVIWQQWRDGEWVETRREGAAP